MTSRNTTPLLPIVDDANEGEEVRLSLSDTLYRLAFGAIGWPWLLVSLWGGTKAEKRRLLNRVGLGPDALPHLGSWKADTGLLHRIVDAVEGLRPTNVVELGAGASSLVCAKALQMNGGGRLFSYDQNADFVDATRRWLHEEGTTATVTHAPLTAKIEGWPGAWYDLSGLPETIDLLIIDGPPWTVHPFVRGAAECLFDRLSPGAVVLLDDGARPGERVIARRWRENWPGMRFGLAAGSTKGTLIGHKLPDADILPFRRRGSPAAIGAWARAAMVSLVFAAGWLANDVIGSAGPASAASFLEEADASFAATSARHRMASQPESRSLDRAEIGRTTGIALPSLPIGWTLEDVQVYPSDHGSAVAMVMRTGDQETLSLFATRAETPAERVPLLERHGERSLAYWESGPFAYALTGNTSSERILQFAAIIARDQG